MKGLSPNTDLLKNLTDDHYSKVILDQPSGSNVFVHLHTLVIKTPKVPRVLYMGDVKLMKTIDPTEGQTM